MATAKKPAARKHDSTLMQRTNFFLPPELHKGLKAAKATMGGSEGDHVRKAVTSYLKRHKLIEAA